MVEAGRYNPVIIAGNFIAWVEDCSNRQTNVRGPILLEVFSRLNVVPANIGGVNTFPRQDMGSATDLKFVNDALHKDIQWQVSEEYTNSGHQALQNGV